MGRNVQDVTVLLYVPRTKQWEATSASHPSYRAIGKNAAIAVLEFERQILMPSGYEEQLHETQAFIRHLLGKKRRKRP